MSAREIGTRLNQEFRKRADLAMYRAGVNTVGSSIGPSSHARQFFSRENEVAERVKILQEHLPQQAQSILREADEICAHRFRLLGFDQLDYGAKIDWHLDAVHGKRAPLAPWFKIPFLAFSVAGDHKVTWELNRHQHLVTLAKAWAITGNEQYAKEIFAQWYDWQRNNPYPLGINWASSLEVAFRSLSWLWVKFLLGNCPAAPRDFESDLLQSLARNGRYIESFLSTYFSPNTHLIGEAAALYSIGELCPEIRLAGRWRRKGWRILEQEAERQVRPDGVYFEQALHYHVYALDFFLHARMLRERNGGTISESFDAVLRRMLRVLSAVAQAGRPFGFGDDDGGRVFDPRRNRGEHMRDPLAVGALVFSDDELVGHAGLTEEAIWLFGSRALGLQEQDRPGRVLRSEAFPSGGLYLMADPERASLLMIDAGPQGTGRSGHGHADALSLQLSSQQRQWLIDPGTSCYISDDDTRARFRSTAAHNTVRIDGLDQAVADGPFGWTNIPSVRVHQWIHGKTFEWFEGSHDGYGRLSDPVTHRRLVFHPHDGPWLVRDVLEGRIVHDVEISWHFAPAVNAKTISTGCELTSTGQDYARNDRLSLLWATEAEVKGEIESSFISPAYGKEIPAKVARVRTKSSLPLEIGTLLSTHAEPATEGFSLVSGPSDSVRVYRYTCDATTHVFFFGSSGGSWISGAWSSDAAVLYCRQLEGRIVHLVSIGGRFVNYAGRELLKNTEVIDRFEWRRRGETGETHVADQVRVEHTLDREIELDSVS